ncbi:MAG TPA: adenosine deaminase [Fimbriimonas sp.]|nr:adenosine deaminase [Fimbriimonas sp.]
MPKVELHVHLEGSIRPETVLKLAQRNNIDLPATDLEGLRDWYRFRDFPHFVQVYVAVTKCIKTADDIELIAREFLEGQAGQNVLHSEVTYTAATVEQFVGIPWPEQEAALKRAMQYGKDELGVSMGLILDIVRGHKPERAIEVAEWAVSSEIVTALGIAGEENRGTSQYVDAFKIARSKDFPIVPHAGETVGPESIWETLEFTDPKRIGHGVRCVEDPKLVRELANRAIPLEVCPGSNVALGVYPTLEAHPLPQMLDAGLYVTINSDDPPMFGTSITDEFARCAEAFEFDEDILWSLVVNAANAAMLPEEAKKDLLRRMRETWPAT